ncbi:MAG: alpha/beta hydrolase [Bacteroidota bacterium]
MTRFFLLLIFMILMMKGLFAQTLYLIPGTGADHHLFDRLDLADYKTVHLDYIEPKPKEEFEQYISRLAERIDTTERFALIGVSLGGMIVTELAEQLQPEAAIVIAGAKHRNELPTTYRIFRHLPVYHLIGGRTMRWSTKRLQPLFEPMDEEAEWLFKDMLNAKSSAFLRAAVRWMIGWERTTYSDSIVHIHGTKDHTLPTKFITADHLIEGGGHMIVYTHASEVNRLILNILESDN